MKKYFLYIFLFLGGNLFAQSYSNKLEITVDSDTLFWLKYNSRIIEKIGLSNPIDVNKFLRISSSKYFIELNSDSGKVIFNVNEILESKETGENFAIKYYLTKEQIIRIYKLYDSLDLLNIPSDRYILEWQQGTDGITYIIESKTESSYSFKNYWTPRSQNKFKESERILEFTNQLDSTIHYQQLRKDFESKIPYYSWKYEGSIFVAFRPITDWKRYKRCKRSKGKLKV